ncbi:MAG: hypothetical protein LBV41_11800 [Cytophagaceae bacterium]|jgi:hypothetical protein|nr:hypothetical protein [Cytophagaceae bacterium]
MKKFLKIFFIAIAVILVLLLVTPVLFKGKIMEFAKKEINNMLTAKVDFTDLKLSFIRNFPNAYVALEDLSVIGTDEFEGDTLVAFDLLSLTVNLKSVITLENIKVKSILLDKAKINAHVLESGKANWDIIKPTDTVEEEDTAVTAAPNIGVALQKFEIRDAVIAYNDEDGKMMAKLGNLNFLLHGDMSMDNAVLGLALNIAGADFWMDGVRLVNSAALRFDSEIDADIKNMAFAFKDNKFQLNDIVLKFAGDVKIPTEDIAMDISFATEKTDFKSLLSLVPAIYMKDFASVQTAGSLALNGAVKGVLNDTQTPNVDLTLNVTNAMFKYPDLPKSVENINIDVKVFYDGVVFDRTTVDVNKFGFTMAGNPFNAEAHVKTPESDPQVTGHFIGKIDINSVSDIVPLDDMKLSGLLDCDLSFDGRLSTIEKEQYEDFKAAGMLKLTNFVFESPDFPQGAKVAQAHLEFTPKVVNLAAFDAVVGRTDVQMNGALENFIPFVLKNETIKGRLALSSKMIDLNEFMSSDETAETETVDSTALAIIEVPKNIDFTLNANLGTILFDKLNITNTNGVLLVKDGIVSMQKLGMNLLDGSVVLNGHYNTADMTKPFVDFGIDANKLNIPATMSSFSMLEKFFPTPQDYGGRVSAKLTLYSLLNGDFTPDLNSVASKGRLNTHNIEIRNSKLLGTISDVTKNERWRTMTPVDLNINFEVKDGRLSVEPFDMKIDKTVIGISGDQGLDMTMNYKLNIAMPKSALGAGANLLDKVPGAASLSQLSLTGLIGGTVTNPDIKITLGDMGNVIKDAVKEVVTEKIEEVKEKVTAEVNKQIENILAEANKQAANLRSKAKEGADKVRKEANTAADKVLAGANAAADKVEKEAASKSVIEKRLAKTAADKLRKEGEAGAKKVRDESEANAKKIEAEADKQAQSILDTANKQADELRKKQ